MRKVYTALNLPEAHLVLHLLQHEGIDAVVFNENACSMLGEIPLDASLPEIWVKDAAFEARARRAIEAYCRRRTSGVVRFCSECGEQNPEEFEICWNCSLAFPITD
ncbi:MAG: DUF2007 domain-containing protein [Pseudomonadota bacterium]